MNKILLGIIIGLLSQSASASGDGHYKAIATLFDKDHKAMGKIVFSQQKYAVQVQATVTGLTPGFHGFHIHTTGLCVVDAAPAKPFVSANGHFKLDPASTHQNHSGDFPVLLANKDGVATANFKTDRFKIKELFDTDGSAVIIHANPDNYANIPSGAAGYTAASVDVTNATLATGDAGGRVVCGVVKKQ
jgi:superoxide dismutase, Cu-Zn family